MVDPKSIMIEFYAQTVRFGVEGKWVAWMTFEDLFMDGHKPTRKEMRAIIEAEDQRRSN